MDKIKITDLEIFARHGVMPEETTLGQKFIISAELSLSLEKAGMCDSLEDSVNYAEVCECIKTYNEKHTKKLIEAAAEGTAEQILQTFSLVKSVKIEIKKPNPPIHLHFSSVAVEIERGRHRAFVAFGSNMGDRQAYIDEAVAQIESNPKCRIKKISTVIETKPYGGVEQDNFLNGVIELETLYSPYALLDFLHELEKKADRKREIHWGPRTLDLDIIFYDDMISDDIKLTLPHPDMHNRDFVVLPMCELAPSYIHPVFGEKMTDLKINL